MNSKVVGRLDPDPWADLESRTPFLGGSTSLILPGVWGRHCETSSAYSKRGSVHSEPLKL